MEKNKKPSDALKQSGKLMTSPYQSSETCLKSVSVTYVLLLLLFCLSLGFFFQFALSD